MSLECQSLYPDANATISTPTVTDTGPNGARIHVTFARGLSGLTPGTTYHYHVALQQGLQAPSYSGADQQFATTGALGGGVHQRSRLVTIAPERASSLLLTAPTRAGQRVFLRRPAGSPATPGRWRFVSAQTGEALTAQINRRRVRQGKAAADASWTTRSVTGRR